MQFQYFADPSHDTEAYRELVEQWWDGLCLPHGQRNDYFCHEKDPVFGSHKTYVLCIRFYGAKNWLNGVLGNPAYFILSITTCLSFYEKTNSYENYETDRNVQYDNHGLYLDHVSGSWGETSREPK